MQPEMNDQARFTTLRKLAEQIPVYVLDIPSEASGDTKQIRPVTMFVSSIIMQATNSALSILMICRRLYMLKLQRQERWIRLFIISCLRTHGIYACKLLKPISKKELATTPN